MRFTLRSNTTKVGAVVLAVAGALMFTAGASAAGAASVEVSHTLTAETPFCATQALTVEQAATRSAKVEADCYTTRSEALAIATGIAEYKNLSNEEAFALTEPGGALRGDSARSGGITPLSTALLSVDSADWHYEGATNYWYGQTTGCDFTGYVANTMPSGWDNAVSSSLLVATGGCDYNWHYEGTFLSGAAINCDYTNRCYYIGDAMNDQTSSESWG